MDGVVSCVIIARDDGVLIILTPSEICIGGDGKLSVFFNKALY